MQYIKIMELNLSFFILIIWIQCLDYYVCLHF
jgi:hypothetical protein